MSINPQRVWAALAGALLLIPSVALAGININFDSDAIGSPPSTSVLPADPVTKPYAIGGYAPGYESPPTPAAGTIIVDNAPGMSQGAVMTTNAANPALGALWLDVNGFSLPGQAIHVSFDVNILSAPTSATTQPKILGGGIAGIVLGMNAYTTNGWAYRFAAAPTSDTGGVFAFRTEDNTTLIPFFDYVEGQTYDVDILANYSTGTLDAYINGVLELDDYSFWASGASNVETNELFFHLNGEEDFSSSVALDNITAEIVPEPTTFVAWSLLGLISAVAWRRGKSRNAA